MLKEQEMDSGLENRKCCKPSVLTTQASQNKSSVLKKRMDRISCTSLRDLFFFIQCHMFRI